MFPPSEDGDFDQEAALKSVDAMSVNSGVKQPIRQKLTIAQPDRSSHPNGFNTFISTAEDRMSKGESVKNIVAGTNITRNLSANDKQRAIAAIRAKQEADKTPAVGGSVEAVKAIAGRIKDALTSRGEPPEPVAAQ